VEAATALVKKQPKSPKAHYELGRAYYKQRLYDHAIPAYQEAVRLEPKAPLPYFGLGYSYNAAGNPQQACQVFQQLVRLNLPSDDRSSAYLSLGNSYWDLKQLKKAEQAYQVSLRYDAHQDQAWYGLGLLAALRNRLDEARRYFLAAKRDADTERSLSAACAALGKLAEQQGDIATAVVEYRAALQADKSNERALEGLKRLVPH
jgi:tetratricopeptide (TPR) repeat protein